MDFEHRIHLPPLIETTRKHMAQNNHNARLALCMRRPFTHEELNAYERKQMQRAEDLGIDEGLARRITSIFMESLRNWGR